MASRKAKGQGGLLEKAVQSRVKGAIEQARGLGQSAKGASSAERYQAARKAQKEGRVGAAYIARRQANAVAHVELSRKTEREIKKVAAQQKAYDRAQKVKKAKQKVKKAVNKVVNKVRGKKK